MDMFLSQGFQSTVQQFLHSLLKFESGSKKWGLSLCNEKNPDIKIRVQKNPPSAQVIRLPQGGARDGAMRIHEKLNTPSERKNEAGIHVAVNQIVVANEYDLTRECIIATLSDTTVATIVEHQLIDTRGLEKIALARIELPGAFVILQRYLMGIEHADGISVPFQMVDENDSQTLDFLASLCER